MTNCAKTLEVMPHTPTPFYKEYVKKDKATSLALERLGSSTSPSLGGPILQLLLGYFRVFVFRTDAFRNSRVQRSCLVAFVSIKV